MTPTRTPMPAHRPSADGATAIATVPATVFRVFNDGPKSYDIAIYDDTMQTKLDTWNEKQFRVERIGKTMLPLPTKRKPEPEKVASKTQSISPTNAPKKPATRRKRDEEKINSKPW